MNLKRHNKAKSPWNDVDGDIDDDIVPTYLEAPKKCLATCSKNLEPPTVFFRTTKLRTFELQYNQTKTKKCSKVDPKMRQ